MRSLDQIRRKTRGPNNVRFNQGCMRLIRLFHLAASLREFCCCVLPKRDTRLRCTIEFIALRICTFCIRCIIEEETRGLHRGEQKPNLKEPQFQNVQQSEAFIAFLVAACRYIKRRRTLRVAVILLLLLFSLLRITRTSE